MHKIAKRILDISISFFFLIFLLPILLFISILIKIDSKGPVFFKQDRVGYDGNIFQLYKFRSMYNDKKGAHFTTFDDPRITRVGKIIRRTSIDELPQLLNVLKGDMSLVGPRPNVPRQKDEYRAEDWALRNSVLPGITGLAQVKLRSLATPEERLFLDLEYIRKNSLLLDLKIIVQTALCLFSKKGN